MNLVKRMVMNRLLLVMPLAIALIVLSVTMPLAEDSAEPIIVKVYKSPG